MHSDAFIYAAIRTPRGRGRESGALAGVTPVEMLVALMDALRDRLDMETALVDDVVLGCVTPVGEQGANIARTALLMAGWDPQIPGMQLNRYCASGLEAVNLAAARVRSGWDRLVAAGGVESMSRVPMGTDGGALMDDPTVREAIGFVPQGISADLIATLEGFSRPELDAYALQSQQRAARAQAAGYFASLVPLFDSAGRLILAEDETLRPGTTAEALAGLAPAFARLGASGFDQIALAKYPQLDTIEHRHTAGNSSVITDGAALVLVGNQAVGDRLGLRPRGRVVATALVGTEPTIMLTGPAPATERALHRAGMSLDDIDLIECNEAFAAVVLKFMRELASKSKADLAEKINVNGGAIALGHPLGATGAMLLGAVLDELERRDLSTGLVTLCAGGGMGIATIVERMN